MAAKNTAARAEATAPQRLSDEEWLKRETDFVAKSVDRDVAERIAKRNLAVRDKTDALRARPAL